VVYIGNLPPTELPSKRIEEELEAQLIVDCGI
jgi:hypothetical protein